MKILGQRANSKNVFLFKKKRRDARNQMHQITQQHKPVFRNTIQPIETVTVKHITTIRL